MGYGCRFLKKSVLRKFVSGKILIFVGIWRFREPFREMYGAYWVGMVLPNPMIGHANIAGVMGVEHVRYEGRLGVTRRRWTTGEIISGAYGHVCRLYARIRCCMGPIWRLVGHWECTGRWLDSWCSSGLSTDMLVVLTPAPRSVVFGPLSPLTARYLKV